MSKKISKLMIEGNLLATLLGVFLASIISLMSWLVYEVIHLDSSVSNLHDTVAEDHEMIKELFENGK